MSAAAIPKQRLVSLDVFRGLTIASMVMVNNQFGPGAYRELRHAAWNGWTFTDLVFPFFLFIVGVALTLSSARRKERGDSKPRLLRHAAERAAWIFGIGVLLNGFPGYDLASLRIPGVLQRIAVCYLIALAIYLYTDSPWTRAAWALGFLILFTALMHPHGYEKNTNLSDQVDRKLLLGHLYTPTRDPEGPLSNIPAVTTCLLGVLAGDWLRARRDAKSKAMPMIAAGAALVAAAYALNPLQPINKNLWTPTYVLLAGGLALIAFAICYQLVDVARSPGAWTTPCVIFGMNAMAVYIFHGLLEHFAVIAKVGGVTLRQWLYDGLLPALGAANASLVYSLMHVAFCFLFAWRLYRRHYFFKF
ncbi:MAG: heparan-alpha-glucosaminide N-acetyltransferase domain-containing protein [Bryobacteraceae bacterium]